MPIVAYLLFSLSLAHNVSFVLFGTNVLFFTFLLGEERADGFLQVDSRYRLGQNIRDTQLRDLPRNLVRV